MNCCVNCFVSSEIKGIIKSMDNTGNCDFCKSINVNTYNLDTDEGIEELFFNMLTIFKPSHELISDGFPRRKLISLKDEFERKWNVFNKFDNQKIYIFLEALLSKKYPEKVSLLDTQVGIIEWMNQEYLEKNSVLKGSSWDEFVNYIKHENRFHSNHINYDVLKDYIKKLTITIEGETFYRGRISNIDELTTFEMSAPPPISATAGRANSEGISHLYLASDIGTVISEIRPSLSDVVYIGKFPIKQRMKVVDFRVLKALDVFRFEDYTMYAINLEILNEMSNAISKPVRSGDSKLDYLPTQYIVDFIKSLNITEEAGYQGIVFESTLSTSGYNLMIFDPSLLACENLEKRIVQNLNYNYPPFL